MKKILFVASEAVPFIKTGGLADVCGTLPKYFDSEEYDVRVILPKYLCMKANLLKELTFLDKFYMYYNGRERYVGIMTYVQDGITFYFIDNEEYFGGATPYGDWLWDIEKFCYFSYAALSALPVIGFQPDIVHCHDWQSGLVPVLLKGQFSKGEYFKDMKSIMTVHNLRFQGVWSLDGVKHLTMLGDEYFTPDKLEAYGDGNLLKGGLAYCDKITTVSKTYAEEIKTAFYGEHLDGLIRARSHELDGIVNGIDYDSFNPETDPDIAQTYSVETYAEGKAANKAALQKELGLPVNPDCFMMGIVSRLTDQKGLDLIACVMEELCAEDVQFVILGSGDSKYEDMFKYYADKYPDRVAAYIGYSEPLSHRVYAACDSFLMPSLFEPCGLSQLMSMRYGTLPIVRETGGLKDTVLPYNEYEGTGHGFSFTNYNAHDMLHVVELAKDVFYNKKEAWDGLVNRAMTQDFSWGSSARQYEALYDDLLKPAAAAAETEAE